MGNPPGSSRSGLTEKVFSVEENGFRVTNRVKEYMVSARGPLTSDKLSAPSARKSEPGRKGKPASLRDLSATESVGAAVEQAAKGRTRITLQEHALQLFGAGLVVALGALMSKMQRRKSSEGGSKAGHDGQEPGSLKGGVPSDAELKLASANGGPPPARTPLGPGSRRSTVMDAVSSPSVAKGANFPSVGAEWESPQDPSSPYASSACTAPPALGDDTMGVVQQRSLSMPRKDIQRLRQQLKSRDEMILDMNAQMAEQGQLIERHVLAIRAFEEQVAVLQQRNPQSTGMAEAVEPVDFWGASKGGAVAPRASMANGHGSGHRDEELESLQAELRRLQGELKELEEERWEMLRRTEEREQERQAAASQVQEAVAELEKVQRHAKGKDRMIEGYEKERVHLTAVLQELERKVELQAREIEAVMRLDAATAAAVGDQQSSNNSDHPAPLSPASPRSISKGRCGSQKMVPESKESPASPPPRARPGRGLELMRSFENPLSKFSPTPSPSSGGPASTSRISMRLLGNPDNTSLSNAASGQTAAENGGGQGGQDGVHQVSRLQQEVEQLADELTARYRLVAEKREETGRLVEDLQRHNALINDLQRKIDDSAQGLQQDTHTQQQPIRPPLLGNGTTNSMQVAELQEKLEQVAIQQRVEEQLCDIDTQELRILELKNRVKQLVTNAMRAQGTAGQRLVRSEADLLGEELAAKLAAQEQKAAEEAWEVRRLSASLQLASPYVPASKKEALQRVLQAELRCLQEEEADSQATTPNAALQNQSRYAFAVDTPTPVKAARSEPGASPAAANPWAPAGSPHLRASRSLAYPPAPAPSAANSRSPAEGSSAGPLSPSVFDGSLHNRSPSFRTASPKLGLSRLLPEERQLASEWLTPVKKDPQSDSERLVPVGSERLVPAGSEQAEDWDAEQEQEPQQAAAEWLQPVKVAGVPQGGREEGQGGSGSRGRGSQTDLEVVDRHANMEEPAPETAESLLQPLGPNEKGPQAAQEPVQPLASPEWRMSEELDRLTKEMELAQEAEDSAAVVIGSPTATNRSLSMLGMADGGAGNESSDDHTSDGAQDRLLMASPPLGPAFREPRRLPLVQHGVASSMGLDDLEQASHVTVKRVDGSALSTPPNVSPRSSQLGSSPGTMDWALHDMLNDTLDDMVRVCTPGTSATPTPAPSSKAPSEFSPATREGIGRGSLEGFWRR